MALSRVRQCHTTLEKDIYIFDEFNSAELLAFEDSKHRFIDADVVFYDILTTCATEYEFEAFEELYAGAGGIIYDATMNDIPVVIKFSNLIEKGPKDLDEITYTEYMSNVNIGPRVYKSFYFSFRNEKDRIMLCIIMDKGNMGTITDIIEKTDTIQYNIFDDIVEQMIDLIYRQVTEYDLLCHDIKPDNFVVSIPDLGRPANMDTNRPIVRMIDFDGYYCYFTYDRLTDKEKQWSIQATLIQIYYMTGIALTNRVEDRTPMLYGAEHIVRYLSSFWIHYLFPLRAYDDNLEEIASFLNNNLVVKSTMLWYIYGQDPVSEWNFTITRDALIDICLFIFGTEEAATPLPYGIENEYIEDRIKVNRYIGPHIKKTFLALVECYGSPVYDDCEFRSFITIDVPLSKTKKRKRATAITRRKRRRLLSPTGYTGESLF